MCIIFIVGGCIYIYINQQRNDLTSEFKEIQVVLDDNYPPYVFKDEEGNLSGILVDEWNLWSIKTGIKVKLYGTSWDNALKLMNEGKFDVIDTIFENEERSKVYDFTKGYADIEVPIIFNSKISAITDICSLKGFKVAVKKGDNIINLLKEKGINDYMEFDSFEGIVKAAKDGKVDVFIIDKPSALYYIYKYGIQNNFKFTASQYTGQFHRAVKKGNSSLVQVIDKGFSKIRESEHKKIYNKWFGFEYLKTEYLSYFEFGFCIVFVMIVIMLLLSIILNKKVKQKTLQLTEVIAKLVASESRINAILKANPDMFFILNDKYEVIDYKLSNDSILIWEPELFLRKPIYEVLGEEISNKMIAAIKKTIETDEMQIIEYSYMKSDKERYHEARIVKYAYKQVLAVIRDITEKKQTVLKIYEMSIKDGVTGLYNRNYFENILNSLKTKSVDSLIIVICDLDGLKFTNDTLGHIAGDNYLKTAANIIKKSFDIKDTVIARIGGDEFGIILTDVTEKTVINMRNKLKILLEEENKNNNNSIPLSISFGYSIASGNNIDTDKMIKEADDFMYRQKLHNKQSTKNDLVKVMTKMLETRDFITEGHSDRLQFLGVDLAKKARLSDRDIEDISLLCKFHDIGKIGISDNILFKPSRLTTEEFQEMKKHTEIGYRIAQASPNIVHLAEYILKHHEWWNGNGYPLGLKGEDIPIQCRILSIVDAYDAMISDRPYRKAQSKKEAMDEIIKSSGTQFDPELVDRFIEMINEMNL
jgi:diguanylate cyclase (GGDEF) domain